MSLIDRYIAEVGRHLPGKDRADIEAEIRSTLEDVLEEKSGQTGRPVDEANIANVLQEFGDPALLAQQYSPSKRYLIGPRWFDAYVEFLKRILYTAVPVFMIVGLFMALAVTSENIIVVVARVVAETFKMGALVCFWVTLAFVLVERSDARPNDSQNPVTKAWKVSQLPELPKKRQISVGEAVAGATLAVGSIALVALSPIIARVQTDNESVPFVNPDLWQVWLPIFFAIAGLTLIHELFKFKIGNWTPALTITNVILGLVSITYITALAATQQVINPAYIAALADGVVTAELRNAVVWTVDLNAAIIISIYLWSMGNSIRMARRFDRQKA